VAEALSEAVHIEVGADWQGQARRSRLVVLGLGLDAAALEAGFLVLEC